MNDQDGNKNKPYIYKPHKFIDETLPNSNNIQYYGKAVEEKYYYVDNKLVEGVYYQYKHDISIFVQHTHKLNERHLIVFKDGVKYNECVEYYNKNSAIYKRVYKDGRVVFINNETLKIEYFEHIIPCKALTTQGILDFKLDLSFSTFDIECYTDENKIFKPYACGYLDPTSFKPKLYYSTDYGYDSDKMLITCILDMLKSDIGTVYVHNLSRFDIYFIHKIILKEPTLHTDYKYNKQSKILSLKISFKHKIKGKKYPKIIFRDSLLLIPVNLKKLTSIFKTETRKDSFPHSFVNYAK